MHCTYVESQYAVMPNDLPYEGGVSGTDYLSAWEPKAQIGVGKAHASPPSEPCVRFSRTRLSS
jgi:hypothetical protein